jgi:hypothetical protein
LGKVIVLFANPRVIGRPVLGGKSLEKGGIERSSVVGALTLNAQGERNLRVSSLTVEGDPMGIDAPPGKGDDRNRERISLGAE